MGIVTRHAAERFQESAPAFWTNPLLIPNLSGCTVPLSQVLSRSKQIDASVTRVRDILNFVRCTFGRLSLKVFLPLYFTMGCSHPEYHAHVRVPVVIHDIAWLQKFKIYPLEVCLRCDISSTRNGRNASNSFSFALRSHRDHDYSERISVF